MSHRRRRGRGRGAEAPLNENWGGGGGSASPRFGPENIGNAAENWFGKIFRLVIFTQIVSEWSRLAKYYFLGLFEQLHPDFEKPIEYTDDSRFPIDATAAFVSVGTQSNGKLKDQIVSEK